MTTSAPSFMTRGRWLLMGAAIAAVGVAVASRVGGAPDTPPVTLPAGTTFVAALEQSVSTENAEVGKTISLRTSEPVTLPSGEVIPEGATISGEVTHSKDGGRVAGAPELTLRFHRLELAGATYAIVSEPFRVVGKNDAKESALSVAGGAVAGAVVGAIAGDAAKGAVVGAVIGSGVAIATDGDNIVLPVGQKLRVRLAEPVEVRLAPPAT